MIVESLPIMPVPFRRFDHRDADAVLDGTERVEELAFDGDLGVEPRRDAVEPHQRCSPDRLGDVAENLTHSCPPGRIRS